MNLSIKELFAQLQRLVSPTVSIDAPKDPNELGKGKTFLLKDDQGNEVSVVALHIVGNRAKPRMFEINGKYLIEIIEFYCQLEGRRPTEEEWTDWNSIQVVSVEAPKPKGKTK